MSTPKVTVGIATCDRYDTLSATLLSIALQTFQDIEVIVVDDSSKPIDPREHDAYKHVFTLLNFKKIPFHWVYGKKLGQHHSHQLIQEKAQSDWVWRIDDDEAAEADVLSKLWQWTSHEQTGAIGGLVPQGSLQPAPAEAANVISDLTLSNLQWFSHGDRVMPIEVEHLTSSFLYRRGIAQFNPALSPVAHREETLFTAAIGRAGYKLLVEPSAITWHVRGAAGGIRTHTNPSFYDHDEKLFQAQLEEWGVTDRSKYPIIADCGLGDSVIILSLLPELKSKYRDLIIYAAHPTVFENSGVELRSVAEAVQRFGSIDSKNIYAVMSDWGWKGSLQDAYRKLLGV